MLDYRDDIELPKASDADRNVPMASKGHCTSNGVFGVGAGYRLQGESWLEYQCQQVISTKQNVQNLREQVHFIFGEDEDGFCEHFFDLFAVLDCGTRIAITIKPEARLVSGRFISEMQEIAWWVNKLDFADETRLVSDADLDPIMVANAGIYTAVREVDEEADWLAASVVEVLPDDGGKSLRELSQDVGIGQRGYTALIRQVRDGALQLMRHEIISPDAILMKPSSGRARERVLTPSKDLFAAAVGTSSIAAQHGC